MHTGINFGKYTLWGFMVKRVPASWDEYCWTIMFGPIPGVVLWLSWIRKTSKPIEKAFQSAHDDLDCSWKKEEKGN